MSMLDRAYCRDIPPGVNTEDVPETLILSSFQTYVYSCLPGYFSEDLMSVTCLPGGSLSMDYGPNCTGKWQRVNEFFGNICCLLFAVCYLLVAVCYLLSAICYLLFAGCYLLVIICCLIFAVCYLLFAVCILLFAIFYLLFAIYWLLSAVCYLPVAICCSLFAGCYLLFAIFCSKACKVNWTFFYSKENHTWVHKTENKKKDKKTDELNKVNCWVLFN